MRLFLIISHPAGRFCPLSEPPPSFPSYGPNPTAILARLVEDRDRIQAQIDLAERGLESMRGSSKNDGVADLLEASTLGPLRGMLAQVEEQISNVQKMAEGEGLQP